MTRTESLLRVTLVYVLALGTAAAWLAWGPDTGRLWLDALVADVLATLVVFAASRWHGSSSCYDAYWSVLPPFLACSWVLAGDGAGDDLRTVLVLLVVWVWAVRLTANWVVSFPGLPHEDWRYPLLRERAGRWGVVVDLFAIHLVPTLQVFLGLLPVYVAVARPGREAGWLDGVALVLGLGAVLLELVADGQMRRFVRASRPGDTMDRGLWGWSRHPNYLGEIAFWVALVLFGVAAAPGDWWWLPVGAAAMVAMFLGVSIPMMEARSLERRPSYQDVVDRVPVLLPRLPRRDQR